jgi:hypothetical protein
MDEFGFLPHGVHDCTLVEIHTVFTYSTRRLHLWINLSDYCELWRNTKLPVEIYVDGGFVTRKPEEPKDIDIVVDVSSLDLRDPPTISAVQPLFDRATVRVRFELDVYAFHPVIVSNDLRAFFSYVKPERRAALGLSDSFRKGLLRVQL